MKDLRSAALTSTDFHGMAVDPLTHPMMDPIATDAAAHSQSTSNPMTEHKTTFKKPGSLGGTGQAGN
jgi:hypothetical protein